MCKATAVWPDFLLTGLLPVKPALNAQESLRGRFRAITTVLLRSDVSPAVPSRHLSRAASRHGGLGCIPFDEYDLHFRFSAEPAGLLHCRYVRLSRALHMQRLNCTGLEGFGFHKETSGAFQVFPLEESVRLLDVPGKVTGIHAAYSMLSCYTAGSRVNRVRCVA